MRALLVAVVLLLAAPITATADVIFDPTDADDLAATLAEAYTDQNVCYGWSVTVDDVATRSESIGSNFGAGKSVQSGSCPASVEFTATITYTSESSESEDSASFDVHSTPAGVGRDDLLALDLNFDDLTGEDPDVVIGKAVTALPLLAADKGLAKPVEAAPETGATPADAQLTDDPGSDWWRDRSGMLIWSLILMAVSGILIWAVLKTSRGRRLFPITTPKAAPSDDVPLYVPDIVGEQLDPDLGPATKRRQEPPPPATKRPAAKPSAAKPSAAKPSAAKPSAEEPAADESPAEEEPPSDGKPATEPPAPPAPEPPAKTTPPEPPSTEGTDAEPAANPASAKPTSAAPTSSPQAPSADEPPADTPPESAVDDPPKPPENKE